MMHRMPGKPTTIAGVIERLHAIDAELPSTDGVAVFNRVYLTVTEQIAAGLGEGMFVDPDFMAELDVRFARLWLDAYAAAAGQLRIPRAWAPLFAQRTSRALLPIQFALSGINAHIEHDLPLAVVSTCQARGASPRRRAVRADYEAVNDVIAEVEADVRRSFLTEIGRRVEEEVGALVHLVNSWNIDKARDLAWVSVEALWAVRRLQSVFDNYCSALAHTVGMTSRLLLTPVLAGREDRLP
jgi:Family of unknown function (DUF5995)